MATDLVKKHIPSKRYLGDGVYVDSCGWGIAVDLTTENGVAQTNHIVLEPAVWRALSAYMKELETGVQALIAEKEASK